MKIIVGYWVWEEAMDQSGGTVSADEDAEGPGQTGAPIEGPGWQHCSEDGDAEGYEQRGGAGLRQWGDWVGPASGAEPGLGRWRCLGMGTARGLDSGAGWHRAVALGLGSVNTQDANKKQE